MDLITRFYFRLLLPFFVLGRGFAHISDVQSSSFAFATLTMDGFPKAIELYRALWGSGPFCETALLGKPDDEFGCTITKMVEPDANFVWVVKRGRCTFYDKAAAAAATGAKGVIVVNDRPGLLRMPSGKPLENDDKTKHIFIGMMKNATAASFLDSLSISRKARLFTEREGCLSQSTGLVDSMAAKPVPTSACSINSPIGWAAEAALATFGSLLPLDENPYNLLFINSTLCNASKLKVAPLLPRT